MCLCTETPELPIDLVMQEILTRLPAKSLLRFLCVSKLWLSFIRSQYFQNRFLTIPFPRLYMCLWDLSDYSNSETLTLVPSDTPSSFIVNHDLSNSKIGGHILQTLGGFMCYVYWRNPRIYNPATMQLQTLLFKKSNHMIVPPGGRKFLHYYFGYDPVNNKYKMICSISVHLKETLEVISSENWIFVVRRGKGSWKKAAVQTPTDFRPHIACKLEGLCIDGVIFYMALTGLVQFVVVSFDIRSEEFNMIQVPRRDGDMLRDKGVVALWVLEDAGNKTWSCKNLVVQPSQLHLINSIRFSVKGTTQKGKVLLIPEDFFSHFHILSYDL